MKTAALQVDSATGESRLRRRIEPAAGAREAVVAWLLRVSLRLFFKTLMRPPFPVSLQRRVIRALTLLMPNARGTSITVGHVDNLPVERVSSQHSHRECAILYLHGGAFCTGSPRSHRSITGQLARLSGAEVLVPAYRLAPEHPFPAQIEDAIVAYKQLLKDGYAPHSIAVVGDSAGGTLAFTLPMVLRERSLPLPGALVLLSPALTFSPESRSAIERAQRDPMIHLGWASQAMKWYAMPSDHCWADRERYVLLDMPPTLIQVGEDEILFDDSVWAFEALQTAGRPVELETYARRWHVFQIHAQLLESANSALRRQADFIVQHCGTPPPSSGVETPATPAARRLPAKANA